MKLMKHKLTAFMKHAREFIVDGLMFIAILIASLIASLLTSAAIVLIYICLCEIGFFKLFDALLALV